MRETWEVMGGDGDPYGAAILDEKRAIAEVYEYEDAHLLASAPKLAEAVENLANAVEEMLANYGLAMSDGTFAARNRLVRESRLLVLQAKGGK